jgi:ABC-2 type transport system ATP-binding protein
MIKVEKLTKNFGPKVAVSDVSFAVERGEVLGFLGPNGAGKSTTMRMITGFIPPTDGKVTVGGFDMWENPIPAKRLIGYLPENAPSYADMTVWGFLNFAAELRGLRGDPKKKAVERSVELCFLESVLHQTIETLSKGYRHRTCFAQSIIHDPDVLILDEPTDGLDPNQKHEIRTLIKKMGQNKVIIFSTHILEEVEAVCSRAMIIDRGRIVANGTPSELKRRSENAGSVIIKVNGVTPEILTQALGKLGAVYKSVVMSDQPATVRLLPKPESVNGELLRSVWELSSKEGWKVQDLHRDEGRLDEVFRNITLPETVKEARPACAQTQMPFLIFDRSPNASSSDILHRLSPTFS